MPQTKPAVPAVQKYFTDLSDKFVTGQAREHAYRPVFETLIQSLEPSLKILNDPSRSEHGNPDFVFLRGSITVGYTETKDIGIDLDKTEKSDQLERYLGYSNLILTDYLEFRFFRNGQRYGQAIRIGEPSNGALIPRTQSFDELEDALIAFLSGAPEKIKSGRRLAGIMGGKGRRIRDNVRHFLNESAERNKELLRVYETIKRLLVHDLTHDAFADMYAQTLVYGLFVARYHAESGKSFTRQEARDLIPASNPFLRHFFDHIAGADFDTRLGYIVDELCEVFSVADVHALMQEYFRFSKLGDEKNEAPDPVIHFYEDFLREYDAEQRKKLGAFYTPLPVVRFIIRSVDHLLEKDFDLSKGLADTEKITVERLEQGKKGTKDIHRVQILDPATGTGTFLNETVRSIAARFKDQAGRWSAYVDADLLPRLHGFELMMAPYTIAHLKLGMTLQETGYLSFNRRLGIYLTNSLEESDPHDGTLFAGFGLSQSIAEEAHEAGIIKRETPIMVVIGNPPYSSSSSNKGEWIQNLIKPYKEGLGERKINLDDDYIKFIRYAEHFIEKNGTGIVAMITNNSYIDGITHRQMRKHLLGTFDSIYIADLHGNSKKKEKAPDGGKDENVFDIQQGVAISIFVRTGQKKNALGIVYHSELWGKREAKFSNLNLGEIQSMKWQKLDSVAPNYFFVPKDFGAEESYRKGFSVAELFSHYNSGIQTKRDDTAIQFFKASMQSVAEDFRNLSASELTIKYSLPADGRDWRVGWAKEDIQKGFTIERLQYRPFDIRYTAYTARSKGLIAYPREQTNKHIVGRDNLSLLTSRMIPSNQAFDRVFVTKDISDIHSASDQTYVFPLYLYADDGSRVSSLDKTIVSKISSILGKQPTPEEVFDYIYAILHSTSYRNTYKEFLKIDFPRIPYPKNTSSFRTLSDKGAELRGLHLLESLKLNNFITSYPVSDSNIVETISYKNKNVYINGTQYFGDVPEVAWNSHIGGYLPAQKWLKDRKGLILTNDDIEHYQKMIVALVETERLISEIDTVFNATN
jgi:hypothetical protein